MWPMRPEMTRDECRKCLRGLGKVMWAKLIASFNERASLVDVLPLDCVPTFYHAVRKNPVADGKPLSSLLSLRYGDGDIAEIAFA